MRERTFTPTDDALQGSSCSETITVKIKSRFAPHYLHIEHIGGRVTGISISSPGRFIDSEVGELMTAIGETASQIIEQIGGGG